MELRTTIPIDHSQFRITYDDPVLFIGSCFATSIGAQMAMGHMPVLINPAGTVFNPVSVCNTLDTITSGKEFTGDDLYFYNGNWLSFYHYSDFTSDDKLQVLDRINRKTIEASGFLKKAGFLFITFGTARVYKLRESDLIVSNCHKIPAGRFIPQLLTPDEIVSLWNAELDKLNSLFPGLKIIFTISPVRHWKDGAHGNQVSKSILFIAVEELLKHKVSPQYFPAYELVMDDLRDYRFYDEDMLHPSAQAINYIWDAFADCYLDNKTLNIWKEVSKLTRAFNHHFNTGSAAGKKDFAVRMLRLISELKVKLPAIDFSKEEDYFLKMRM